jgi:hypothetical protein
MNEFAKKVVSLREQVGDSKAKPDRLRRDLVRLAADSHAIERDVAGSSGARPAAADAWARVVRTLDVASNSTDAVGTSGSPRDEARPTDRDKARERDARSGDRPEGRPDAGGLPGELERRVRRAETLADQADLGDAASRVDRFAERTTKLTDQFGALSVDERQDRAKRLLDEARQVQQSLTRQRASPELVDEWNAVIDVLTRMAGAR